MIAAFRAQPARERPLHLALPRFAGKASARLHPRGGFHNFMLTAFDVGVAVLVLISAILATARGLTREVLSLATWAGSAGIAIYMWRYHPEIAEGFIADPMVAQIATVVVTFLVSLIVLHLITMRIADFVVDSRIGPLDRTLGFVFGVVRGVLIAVVFVVFGTWLMPNAETLPWVNGSKTLTPLENFGQSIIAALPPDLENQVTSILQHNGVGDGAGSGDTDQTAGPDDEDGADPGADSVPQEPAAEAGART
jgi:membrane protein required for colicin V production